MFWEFYTDISGRNKKTSFGLQIGAMIFLLSNPLRELQCAARN